MSVQYPSHLYVRVDRPLRADLLAAAEARGVGLSETARTLLRKALGRDDEQLDGAGKTPEDRPAMLSVEQKHEH